MWRAGVSKADLSGVQPAKFELPTLKAAQVGRREIALKLSDRARLLLRCMGLGWHPRDARVKSTDICSLI
jgi:hypothetical protein